MFPSLSFVLSFFLQTIVHRIYRRSPKAYHVSAEMVVADPPMLDGTAGEDGSAFRNARAAHHRIVLVERGGVPLVDKVLRAQAAGALGVLITDTGYCKSFDQFCSAGADKVG